MSKPYQQGQLDGLCGVYALVNAVQLLCGPLNVRQSQQLFEQLLSALEKRGSLLHYCTRGITLTELSYLLKQVIGPQYPIIRRKPFHRRPKPPPSHYFRALDQFLAQPHTAALVGMAGAISHWTLLHQVTDSRLLTFDSLGMQYVYRRSCGLIEQEPLRRHWLVPTHTYFLSRVP